MGIFGWLRRQVAEAVVGGFADAVERLRHAEEPERLLIEHRPAEEGEPAAVEPSRNGRRVKV